MKILVMLNQVDFPKYDVVGTFYTWRFYDGFFLKVYTELFYGFPNTFMWPSFTVGNLFVPE